MNDRATTVAVRDVLRQPESNLKIAGGGEMSLNAVVDLSRSQPGQEELPASAGDLKP